MWFGWGYIVDGDKKMMKLGDRWTYTPEFAGAQTRSFSLIVTDYIGGTLSAWVSVPSGSTNPLHQDHDNAMRPDFAEDPSGWTYSRWTGTYTSITQWDFNYGYADGSIRRLNNITIDGRDDRMTPVAVYNNKGLNPDAGGWYLPKE